MNPFKMFLLLLSIVLCLVAAYPPANARVSVGWLALAAFVAVWLVP